MNKELFHKTREMIKASGHNGDKDKQFCIHAYKKEKGCKTTYCIAGFVCLASGGTADGGTLNKAVHLLSLNDEESKDFKGLCLGAFFPSNDYPQEVYNLWLKETDSDYPKQPHLVAIRAMDIFEARHRKE